MDGARRRLARTLQELLGGSYSHARREVEAGHATVDGEVVTDPGAWVDPLSVVAHRPELPRRRRAPAGPVIEALHVDEAVVVVDKPSGLLVHPTSDRESDTVVSRATALLVRKGERSTRVWVVHRLDQPTSGVLVLARSHEAASALQQQFRVHSVARRYLALVRGDMARPVTLAGEIGRPRPGARRGALAPGSGGRAARTTLEPLERAGRATLVSATLATGRTHQVRVHLSSIGHPVLGDEVYGDPRSDPTWVPRLALHATRLAFTHPATGVRLSFDVALPDDLRSAWGRLAAVPRR